ncbi:hypothetical protein M422DRAFT_245294 [Sphaerobolus stellatus SS14]|nr:hypothetical protein M422DRAFT_245294 [Sphaerobolus stellatus SS14]
MLSTTTPVLDLFNFDSSVEDTMNPCPAITDTVIDKDYPQSLDSLETQIWPFNGSSLASPSFFATESEVDKSCDGAPGLGSMLESHHDESSSSMWQDVPASKGHYSTSSDSIPFTATLTTTGHEASLTFNALVEEAIGMSTPAIAPQLHAQDRPSTAGYSNLCRHAILPLNPQNTEGIGRYIDKLMSDEGLLFKCRTKGCRSPAFFNELEAQEHVHDHFANKKFRCLW